MEKRKAHLLGAAAILIGVLVIAMILLHAWKTLSAPPEQKTGTIEAEAADEIWIDEVELETNEDITLSLKEAVLGEAQQKKDLIVFEQRLSDITKVTDEGKLPFKLSSKYQYIRYSGTAVYTVDLTGIDGEHLKIDEEAKTLTIYIPHAVQKLEINEEETQADETQKTGIFSIGDLKLSEEERNEVIADVKKNMEQKLEDENTIAIADRMAKLSVWEIYQPVVTKVSPEYAVLTEFISD